jgi:hypothetical protein
MPKVIPMAALTAILIGACNGSNPCYATAAAYDCGDCADAGKLCHPTPPSASASAACEMACGTSADQTVLTNYQACLNQVPVSVGACSSSSAVAWYLNILDAVGGCYTGYSAELTLGCLEQLKALTDGGLPDSG